MASYVAFEFAAKTDPGRVRSQNEDSIALCTEYGLVILADGMGGHNAGEVASAMATAHIEQVLESQLSNLSGKLKNDSVIDCSELLAELVRDAIIHANLDILHAAQSNDDYHGMGTTLVLALLHDDMVMFAHVGDSRAYRFRQMRLEQITRDHSLLQEQIDSGLISVEAAQFSQNKNIITRALGIDPFVSVEIHEYAGEVDDMVLLCSDGLSDMLSSQEIAEILTVHGENCEQACEQLIHAANLNGGRDNISVILIKIGDENCRKDGRFGRILRWFT